MHGDARIGQNNDSSLEVVTPEPMWSYALSFDLAEITALANREVEHGDSTVEVELLVTHGHIGVLLVGEDISTPVCREHMARASTEPTILKLSVAARTPFDLSQRRGHWALAFLSQSRHTEIVDHTFVSCSTSILCEHC